MLITEPPGHTIHHVPPDDTHTLDDAGDCWCIPIIRVRAAFRFAPYRPVYEIHAYHKEESCTPAN